MSKNFDLYDYLHNNKMKLKVDRTFNANKVSKPYNDIRKTNLNEVKITNGKFSLLENLEPEKPQMDTNTKRLLLELISTYNTYQKQMQRPSDMTEVSKTLGGIVDAAKHLTLNEAADWFDAVTVKRNMGELEKLDKQFEKLSADAKAMDERLHALYEDMGHLLNRYFQIADISEDTMQERLGNKPKSKSMTNEIQLKKGQRVVVKDGPRTHSLAGQKGMIASQDMHKGQYVVQMTDGSIKGLNPNEIDIIK